MTVTFFDPAVPFRIANERFAGLDGGVPQGDAEGDEVLDEVEAIAEAAVSEVVEVVVPLAIAEVDGLLARGDEVVLDSTAEAEEGRALGHTVVEVETFTFVPEDVGLSTLVLGPKEVVTEPGAVLDVVLTADEELRL